WCVTQVSGEFRRFRIEADADQRVVANPGLLQGLHEVHRSLLVAFSLPLPSGERVGVRGQSCVVAGCWCCSSGRSKPAVAPHLDPLPGGEGREKQKTVLTRASCTSPGAVARLPRRGGASCRLRTHCSCRGRTRRASRPRTR